MKLSILVCTQTGELTQHENVHTLYAQLSWSQYKLLLSVDSQDKRAFYIAETIKNNWTVRQLERQIYSSLYERLLLSNDKESVLAVARKSKTDYRKPIRIISTNRTTIIGRSE